MIMMIYLFIKEEGILHFVLNIFWHDDQISPDKSVHLHGQVCLPVHARRWTPGLSETRTQSGTCTAPPAKRRNKRNCGIPLLLSVLIACISHYRKITRCLVVLINALVIIILTSRPRLQCISFHVPGPTLLVAIVKHYGNKRPGHRWKSKHHY